jgi:hypothetical protein
VFLLSTLIDWVAISYNLRLKSRLLDVVNVGLHRTPLKVFEPTRKWRFRNVD